MANGSPIAWVACAALMLSTVGGGYFLYYSKKRFQAEFRASRDVEAKLQLAEKELGNNRFQQSRAYADEAAKIPSATNRDLIDSFLARLNASEEEYRRAEQTKRQKGYEQFVRAKQGDQNTRKLYDSYFAKFRTEIEANSVTEQHKKELAHVNELFETVGYSKFLEHHERAVREVYSVDNYHENHEAELAALLERRKIDTMSAVADAIAERVPKD